MSIVEGPGNAERIAQLEEDVRRLAGVCLWLANWQEVKEAELIDWLSERARGTIAAPHED